MTLRETMARDARRTLTRLDHFGEDVVYRFKADDSTRTVRAVVNRLGVDRVTPGVPQVGRLRAIVSIPFDDTVGVTAVEKGDVLELPMRLGGDVVTARIVDVISHDEGLWDLEVQA